MLSAVMLLLQLWDNGTRETDNERSAQGTSAPLLPLLQRFQSIICNKDVNNTEEELQVCSSVRLISTVILHTFSGSNVSLILVICTSNLNLNLGCDPYYKLQFAELLCI